MNLHIFPDDKFIDAFIENWEMVSPSYKNRYVIRSQKPFAYVKNESAESMLPGTKAFDQLMQEAVTYKNIFIHQYHGRLDQYLVNFEFEGNLNWVFWGVEFFNSQVINFPLHQQKTAWYIWKSRYLKQGIKAIRDDFWLLRNRAKLRQGLEMILAKFDYFLHFNEFDMNLVKKYFPSFDAKHLQFFYPFNIPLEKLDMSEDTGRTSNGILLGNSGFPMNNHIDVFKILKKTIDKTSDIKIYCPLSYGEEKYTKYIVKKGKELFQDKFIAQLKYLSFAQYANLLNECSYAIMNHNRSAAMGNIIALLFMGKKIFLNKKNPAHNFLMDKGFKIESIEGINENSFLKPLTFEEQQLNKKLVMKNFSQQEVLKNFRSLNEILSLA